MATDDDLQRMRAEIDALDAELIALLGRRGRVAREIGRLRAAGGGPGRDYERERLVLDRASDLASQSGVDGALVRDVMRRVIEASLTAQEHDRVRSAAGGTGRSAMVVGGAGRMGRWMVAFLASQGFDVAVVDPSGPVEGSRHLADWREGLAADVIVLSTPLKTTSALLYQVADAAPGGLVFDVGSLKTPLRGGLEALVASGIRATSVHPMFGPDTRMLCGRHVIFVDIGVPEATTQARELFAHTMAAQVQMSVDEHDGLIAYVLGLSHAVNIAFFSALAGSGESAVRLAQMSSTTFDAQLDIAGRVAHENSELYYEIQAFNAHGGASLDALAASVAQIRDAVRAGDASAFIALMERGRAWFDGRRAASEPAGR